MRISGDGVKELFLPLFSHHHALHQSTAGSGREPIFFFLFHHLHPVPSEKRMHQGLHAFLTNDQHL